MSIQEQISQSRRERRHRNRRAIVMVSCVGVGYLLTLLLLPEDSPFDGLATLGLAACINAVTLYQHRDAFQRRLALNTFAVGAAAGIGWTIVTTIRQALDSHIAATPGQSLGITGGAWALAWSVQQVRIDRASRTGDA